MDNAFCTHRLHFRQFLSAIVPCILIFQIFFCVICWADTTNEANEVKLARKALLEITVQDSLDTRVPPQAMSAISRFKTSIEKLVKAYLKDLPANQAPDTKRIQEDLNRLIDAQNMPLKASESQPFGQEFGIEVGFISDSRRLLHMKAVFSIACGQDSILMIFQPEGDCWKEVLNWQSEPYKAVDGAFNMFQYAISPAEPSGNWYVLGADIPAWCSSCWGTLRYYALRPTDNSTHPVVLLKDWGPLYRCNDNEWEFKLVANQNTFELRFPGNSIDVEILIRDHLRRFEINKGTVSRVEPVALSARDFVDEWIVSSWQEAAKWCTDKDCAKLKKEHIKLNELRKQEGGLQFGAINKCQKASDTVEVELLHSTGEEFSRYFLVKQHNDYKMLRISSRPDFDLCN